MSIRNLTPHTLNIHTDDNIVDIAPDGTVARVAANRTVTSSLGGIPVGQTTYGDVTGLPDAQEGVFLVVSRMVATAVRAKGDTRGDLLVVGPLVRDEAGRPCGCQGLDRP